MDGAMWSVDCIVGALLWKGWVEVVRLKSRVLIPLLDWCPDVIVLFD